MHGSSGLRAVVIAVVALLALVPVPGVDAAAASRSAATPAVAMMPSATVAPGYDISWPQCGGAYPANPAFGIVGVNKGIVFSPNPCLASEVTWAGGTSAALYANTGNPGPALSTHWPTGQTSPQVCSATTPDTAECAYDYGYNAASDSYADAVAAFTSLGLPGTPAGSAWWLDVETSNSWRSDVTLNVAALSGAVDYLGSVAHVASLGFYSTGYQWGVITGGTTAFGAYPSWVAGAADATGAAANCTGPGFTGGGVMLAQYPSGGFDADLRCSTTAPALTTITVTPASASVPANGTQQFTATGHDQNGQPIAATYSWSVSGGGTISAGGLFTAGPAAGGPFTVTATSGSVSGTASVTVTPPPPDFSLSVSPASVSVRRGGTATYTVTVTPSNGFSGLVSLSLSGQPSGSTVAFTPSATATSSTLTVKTSSRGPRVTLTLTITGTNGALTHTASATLSVTK